MLELRGDARARDASLAESVEQEIDRPVVAHVREGADRGRCDLLVRIRQRRSQQPAQRRVAGVDEAVERGDPAPGPALGAGAPAGAADQTPGLARAADVQLRLVAQVVVADAPDQDRNRERAPGDEGRREDEGREAEDQVVHIPVVVGVALAGVPRTSDPTLTAAAQAGSLYSCG